MKKRWIWLLSALLLAALLLPAAVFADGETITLYREPSSKNSYSLDSGYRWETSDDSVVYIRSGVAYAENPGEATLTAYEEVENTETGLTDEVEAKKLAFVVKNREVVDIEATTKPKTSYYTYDALDLSALKVSLVYDSGEKVETTDYTVSIADGATLYTTDKELVITYKTDETIKTTVALDVKEILVSKIEVVQDNTLKFYVGDTTADRGIKIKVTYNNGDVEEETGNYEVTPAKLEKKGTETLTIKYRGKETTLTVNVLEKVVENTYSYSLVGTFTKTKYKVGDKFDAAGLTIKVLKNGADFTTLSSADITSKINHTFTKEEAGKTDFTFQFSYTPETGAKTFTISITAKPLTVSPSVSTITVTSLSSITMKKDTYPIGYRFSVDDIEQLSGKFKIDGESTTSNYKIKNAQFGDYDWELELEVLSVYTDRNGRTSFERKAKNYRPYLEEEDVYTHSGSNTRKYATLRLYVNGSDVSETEIEVGDSGVYVYYTSRSTTSLVATFDDIMDAIDAVNEGDFGLIAGSTSTGSFTIKLGEKQSVTRNYSFEPDISFTIDLNGYDMTIYQKTVYIPRTNRKAVTVTNTSATEAKLSYSDAAYDLKIGKDENVVFEYSSVTDALAGVYTVKTEVGSNGTLAAKPAADRSGNVLIAHGNDITFTLTPAKGYEIDTLTVNKKTVAATDTNYTLNKTTGVVTYVMKDVQASGTVSVTFKQTKTEETPKPEDKPVEDKPAETPWTNPYNDVTASATYMDAVKYVTQNGLMNGVESTRAGRTILNFEPNEKMTRAQFVTTLGRMHFSNYGTVQEKFEAVKNIYGTGSDFTDVRYDDLSIQYAVPFIRWATANGLVNGIGDGKFAPKANITHQEMYLIMQRYATFVEQKVVNVANVRLTDYADASEIAKNWGAEARDKAVDAVKYAHQQNYTVNATRIAPAEDALRYELAMLLYKFSVNVLGAK